MWIDKRFTSMGLSFLMALRRRGNSKGGEEATIKQSLAAFVVEISGRTEVGVLGEDGNCNLSK